MGEVAFEHGLEERGKLRYMDMEEGSQIIEKNVSKILEASFNKSISNFFSFLICIIVLCKILNKVGVSMQFLKSRISVMQFKLLFSHKKIKAWKWESNLDKVTELMAEPLLVCENQRIE